MDRIVENGSKHIALKPVPLEPGVNALRKKYPNASDDERLLRYMFAGSQVDDMLAAGAMQTTYSFDHPITSLIKEFSKRPKIGRIYISKPGLKLDITGHN